jgi:hypothetical protein
MDNAWWTLISIKAQSLRADIRVALISQGLRDDQILDDAVAHVARRMVEAEGRSLLDEVHIFISKMRVLRKQDEGVALCCVTFLVSVRSSQVRVAGPFS